MTYPPMPPLPPTPPRRNNARLIAWTLAGSAVAVGAVAGGVLIGHSIGSSAQDKPEPTTSFSARKESPTREPEKPSPIYDSLDENSFSLDLRTTERQCFGTAGCLVTVEPNLTYLGDSEDIDPDAVYEITYEIHGDESGPVMDTMELSNQTDLSYSESRISTGSSSTKVTIEITAVTDR